MYCPQSKTVPPPQEKDDNRALLLYVPLAMYKSCPDAIGELNCIVFHFMLHLEIRMEGARVKT